MKRFIDYVTTLSLSLRRIKADGTQLAAGCPDGSVVLFSYPSGDILFEIKQHLPSSPPVIVWNPFNRDVLATHLRVSYKTIC